MCAGIRLLGEGQTDMTEANALGHMTDMIHISSNSWGPTDDGRTVEQPGLLTAQVLQRAATKVHLLHKLLLSNLMKRCLKCLSFNKCTTYYN